MTLRHALALATQLLAAVGLASGAAAFAFVDVRGAVRAWRWRRDERRKLARRAGPFR